jgi:glyoxylase-like metal-dependent hydrolase (beta-lactamase superfamily II)
MLPEAHDFTEPFPGIVRWQVFSPAHKVELTTHAVHTPAGWFLFDPIPLAENWRSQFLARATIHAIVLTNTNHERDAAAWSQATHAPIHVPQREGFELSDLQLLPAASPTARWHDWELIPLDGGAPGETAFRWRERSLVIFGDAVFNLPNYGLNVLPEKYCRDHTRLCAQLRELCREPFAHACFAHGEPLTQNASQQILSRL